MADKLIKMVNQEGIEADVHPTMVDDYKKGGYEVKEPAKRGKKSKDEKPE